MRFLLSLMIGLSLAACSPRTTTFGDATGPYRVSFDHYAINVSDLDRSVAFYQRVFGLEEIYDGTQKDNIRWFSLGNGMSLHIIEADNSELQLQKGVHLAVAVADFERFVANLREQQIPFENWPGASLQTNSRPDGVEQVYLKDPDGYWVEINDGRLAWERTAKRKR